MAEIIRVYKESVPVMRFIGKRYTNADRRDGGYGYLWGEWFANGWFETLEALPMPEGGDGSYLGFMRCKATDFDNSFEYWIGMFCEEGTEPPEGYDYVDTPAGEIAVGWIQGPDDGTLYAMEAACDKRFASEGISSRWSDSDGYFYFFERYNCPRFTTPDEQNRVILDYCTYI